MAVDRSRTPASMTGLPSVPMALTMAALLALAAHGLAATARQTEDVQFIFTSDAHYGITRKVFQGHADVPARVVNSAMIAKMNGLSSAAFPLDGGQRAGEAVGPFDFLAEGGDIANREESTGPGPIQSAAASWSQFAAGYVDGIALVDRAGQKLPLYIVPGNHDVSNAVGFYRPMTPSVDQTSMVEIYNRMMTPAAPRTSATYRYATDKVLYSRDICGIHFMFLTIWPDSGVRAWMARDLKQVSDSTPVIVFTHDQPDAEAKHFTNPNGAHDINAEDKFENLLVDRFADGATTSAESVVEQSALEDFLRKHPNVTAYFHGNSNWNQFYDWTGPRHSIALHTFRVDSPMKGAISGQDETQLSFQVAAIDVASRTMTVRECLWNPAPQHPSAPVRWGASTTVALYPRPTIAQARR